VSFATTTHLALPEAGGGRVVLSWRRLHYWHSSYALFGHLGWEAAAGWPKDQCSSLVYGFYY
jgi:hypothetical protein